MVETYGKPNITTTDFSKLTGSKGVYIMQASYPGKFGAWGHASLYHGTNTYGSSFHSSRCMYKMNLWKFKKRHNMKKAILLLILLCITLSCTPYRVNTKYDNKKEMIKELFLYKCIFYGYPEMKLSKYDNSAAVYLELSNYAPEAYSKIDSLAKDFVSKIGYEDTYYENEKTKSLFLQSMEYFKSSELDHFIESLDIYKCK